MKQARILVIEDDTDTADMLKIFFSSLGSSVEIVSTGEQALRAVNAEQPDVIILDILLPDMDGYAVCRKLRSSEPGRHIPIVFLTQKDDRSDILSGLQIGADDYLTKPFDLEELNLRVRNALQRSRTYRELDAHTSLPTGELVRSKLVRLLPQSNWAVLLCRIMDYETIRNSSGPFAADKILAGTADQLERLMRKHDETISFVGYLNGGDFIVITQGDFTKAVYVACHNQFQSLHSVAEGPKYSSGSPQGPAVDPHAQPDLLSNVEVGISLLTADDGPFVDVSGLLDALIRGLDGRNE